MYVSSAGARACGVFDDALGLTSEARENVGRSERGELRLLMLLLLREHGAERRSEVEMVVVEVEVRWVPREEGRGNSSCLHPLDLRRVTAFAPSLFVFFFLICGVPSDERTKGVQSYPYRPEGSATCPDGANGTASDTAHKGSVAETSILEFDAVCVRAARSLCGHWACPAGGFGDVDDGGGGDGLDTWCDATNDIDDNAVDRGDHVGRDDDGGCGGDRSERLRLASPAVADLLRCPRSSIRPVRGLRPSSPSHAAVARASMPVEADAFLEFGVRSRVRTAVKGSI
eukprot:3109458-Pleurochrysis_carterae.AAC.2